MFEHPNQNGSQGPPFMFYFIVALSLMSANTQVWSQVFS